MSATQELIAAALTATDELDSAYKFMHCCFHPQSEPLREACARAMVQPAAPDMAEVERRLETYEEACRSGQWEPERTALLDYVRGILAERDGLIADNERLMQIAAQESDALKPCPFCGSVPQKRDVGDYFVTCPGCGIDGPAGDSDGLPHAADAWNTRADSKLAAAEVPMPERTGHFRNGKPRNEVCYCGNQMKDVQTCQTCGYTLNPQFMEVPMPEENILKIHALDSAEVRWIDREALRTYGDDREAAGYARWIAEFGQDAARYRFLRRKFAIVPSATGAVFHALNLPTPTYIAPDAAIELDASIDAALRGKLQGDDQMNRIERRSHQPKGSMCTSCAKWREDCSGLPFETMPVIVEAPSGVKIVRCTEHAKSSKENKR